MRQAARVLHLQCYSFLSEMMLDDSYSHANCINDTNFVATIYTIDLYGKMVYMGVAQSLHCV